MEQIREIEEPIGFDVVVVGAGAAGLMAAGTAARAGKRVLLLEKMDKSGRKVRITGKGRCNLTNARPPEEFAAQVRVNADFFAPAFAAFNNKQTIKFFEKRGCKLDIERGDRVFPESGKAWDVANALLDYCVDEGVKIVYNTRVTGIMAIAGKVYAIKYRNKRGYERQTECAKVIVATGGLSYPATGSTGDGYAFAADLGHTIEPVRPSLTPLRTSFAQLKSMDGLLLKNVRATLLIDGARAREEMGELGFSDRGIEGALALRLSRDAVDALIDGHKVALEVDIKPGLTEEILRERIERERAELQDEDTLASLLRKLVPKGMVIALAEAMKVHGHTYLRKLGTADFDRLISLLKSFVFPISDYAPFEYAVVTAGGVRCEEVSPQTLESLKVRGLFFAGEVLDLDANTGGYNLQIAFSTGHLAGVSV